MIDSYRQVRSYRLSIRNYKLSIFIDFFRFVWKIFFDVMRILFLAALSPKVNLISHYKISNILIFIHHSSSGDSIRPSLPRRPSTYFFFFPFQCSAFSFLYYLETRSSIEVNKNFDYPSLVHLTICMLKRAFNFRR